MPNFTATNMPWIDGDEVPGTTAPGGRVVEFAAAGALNVGDIVCITADLTVDKSTVAATHQKRIGVVVGGSSTRMAILTASTDVGTPATANAADRVLVCVQGVCYIVADAAIAAGLAIAPSTATAGRARPATSPVVAAGAVAVTSAAANGAATVTGDGFSRVIGHILVAAAANGDVRLALIMPS